MDAEFTRALSLYGSLIALREHSDINQAAARDEITRTIRRIHKKWKTQLTIRLQEELKRIGVEHKPVMSTTDLYRLNKKLREEFGVDRIIHIEHMNGGVAAISNRLMQTDVKSPEHVLQIIKEMTYMAARLLIVEDHLCEDTTIDEFNKWNRI